MKSSRLPAVLDVQIEQRHVSYKWDKKHTREWRINKFSSNLHIFRTVAQINTTAHRRETNTNDYAIINWINRKSMRGAANTSILTKIDFEISVVLGLLVAISLVLMFTSEASAQQQYASCLVNLISHWFLSNCSFFLQHYLHITTALFSLIGSVCMLMWSVFDNDRN